MEILGSIDNAFHVGFGNNGGIFHLIFTNHQLIGAQVMTNREKIQRFRVAQANPLMAVSPVIGDIATYKQVQQETMDILEDSLARGTDIEKDLDAYLKSDQKDCIILNYEDIDNVEFSQGTRISLAHVEFVAKGKKWKYHLNHNNFQKSGKLDVDTFDRYSSILQKVFQEKLTISRGPEE